MVNLLDLYCCEGGAAVGYARAGFDVYGVDIASQRRYPYAFHHGSAIDALEVLLVGGKLAFMHRDGRIEHLGLADFDAIHASPPCQAYSIATAGNPSARAKWDRLIAATRHLLQQTNLPWVIENVKGARSEMIDPVVLCGRMFGLGTEDADGHPLVLDRHRYFESSFAIRQPEHPDHGDEQVGGVYGGGRRAKMHDDGTTPTPAEDRHAARNERGGGYVPRSKAVQQRLLGIDWMTVRGMQESLPPVYTEWIGRQVLKAAAAIRPDQAPEVAA